VDLAREHGLSTQAVRNYEEAGILRPAERTGHGYRTYTPTHAAALRAFLALVPGHGHQTAASIMRAVNRGAADEAFQLIDESHARLLDDRRALHAVETALHDLKPTAPPPPAPPAAPASGPAATASTFIGPLAGRLGIRPATLRKWERAGLIHPSRDPRTGYRVYADADVRDARLAHQLRRGGYPLEQIAPLIAQVRAAGGTEPLEAALASWRARLTTQSRAMLTGAAELNAYLAPDPAPDPRHRRPGQ
jgi:DNA-binding transcriptional MerR regulator